MSSPATPRRPATVDRPDVAVRPTTEDGDHDRFAHYVRKGDLMRAYVEGEAIVALCGKRWVPDRDPERYPLCPTCKDLRARLLGSG